MMVRIHGQTLQQCAVLVKQAGGELIATAEFTTGANPRHARRAKLRPRRYEAPANYAADECPFCTSGLAITAF